MRHRPSAQKMHMNMHKKMLTSYATRDDYHVVISHYHLQANVPLEELCYKKFYGNNEVSYTYNSINDTKNKYLALTLKRYSVKVPYGIVSYPDNGNVALAWFQEK